MDVMTENVVLVLFLASVFGFKLCLFVVCSWSFTVGVVNLKVISKKE